MHEQKTEWKTELPADMPPAKQALQPHIFWCEAEFIAFFVIAFSKLKQLGSLR